LTDRDATQANPKEKAVPIIRSLQAAVLSCAALWSATVYPASVCEKKSPAHRVALVELYTSEGCDSCPPADDFVRNLYKSGVSPEQAVPLSLHVDYWDYIGWRDRFANPTFTERQYWLGAVAHQRNVYTPELFVAGHEERDWRDGDLVHAVQELSAKPATVNLTLAQDAAPGGQVAVTASATGAPRSGSYNLFFAVYENDLVSEVKAGENRGSTLRHSFVVRQWSPPVPLNAQGRAEIRWQKPLPGDAHAGSVGFAAFVQDSATGEVLQALALPSCSS
jgi:hypothetical protein